MSKKSGSDASDLSLYGCVLLSREVLFHYFEELPVVLSVTLNIEPQYFFGLFGSNRYQQIQYQHKIFTELKHR